MNIGTIKIKSNLPLPILRQICKEAERKIKEAEAAYLQYLEVQKQRQAAKNSIESMQVVPMPEQEPPQTEYEILLQTQNQ